MKSRATLSSNFAHLQPDGQLLRLGMLAERYFSEDPITYLLKPRQLSEVLPPLPEHQEIVRRVEDLFAFADRFEARLATAQKTVECLTPTTLAKAFRGELVPQDPNDEPASVLLERLKSAEAAPSATRTRRKRSATV